MDVLTPKVNEPHSETPQSNETVNTSVDTNVLSLKGFLGVTEVTPEIDQQLKYIYTVASQGVPSMAQVLMNIKLAERTLAPTPVGESRLTQLYHYFKIQTQISELYGLKNSMER